MLGNARYPANEGAPLCMIVGMRSNPLQVNWDDCNIPQRVLSVGNVIDLTKTYTPPHRKRHYGVYFGTRRRLVADRTDWPSTSSNRVVTSISLPASDFVAHRSPMRYPLPRMPLTVGKVVVG